MVGRMMRKRETFRPPSMNNRVLYVTCQQICLIPLSGVLVPNTHIPTKEKNEKTKWKRRMNILNR